ncbi:MAG: CPBP family intramembrane glutamic endopeptidase [Ktedonobacterales bacterium]
MSATPDEQPEDILSLAIVPPPPPDTPETPTPARPTRVVPRNTVRDTWGWMWKDTVMRCVPFALAAALYARLSSQGAQAIGVTRDGWRRDLTLGAVLGIPMAAIAAAFRYWVAPHYRLPTPTDQATQSAFYFAVNAPAEELFWRGTVQTLTINGLRHVPGLRRGAPFWGWALITAIFGAYHRLGNWSWRAVAGVTVAGGFFGGLYLLPRKRQSILLPTIVHGFATAGFLSWGDALLHFLAQRRNRA